MMGAELSARSSVPVSLSPYSGIHSGNRLSRWSARSPGVPGGTSRDGSSRFQIL